MRLYKADRFSLASVELDGVPSNIEDLLKYDDNEQQLQHHTSNPPNQGGDAAIFHGQGGDGGEKRKKDIARFFQKFENAVSSYLQSNHLPLMLSGQDFLIGLYRQVNSYEHVFDKELRVNPDDLSDDDLLEKANQVVSPYFERIRDEDMNRYRQLEGTGKAVNELQQAIKASYANRVSTLFVQKGRHIYGNYDENWHDVVFQPQDKKDNVDLIDGAAVQTLMSGGRVHFLDEDEMPEKSMLAAVMRY
jgi:hypothetical protein